MKSALIVSVLLVACSISCLGAERTPSSKQKFTMWQKWSNITESHWSVPADRIRHLVPKELEIDTFDGLAYVSAIAFEMSDGRILDKGPEFVEEIPLFPAYGQINFRTYVKYKGKPGVFFFKVYANSHLVVKAAQLLYKVPFVHAKIERSGNHQHRWFRAKQGAQIIYNMEMRDPQRPRTYGPGTLEHFLSERNFTFQLVKKDKLRCIYESEVSHVPWRLSLASVNVRHNGLFFQNGISSHKRLPFNFYVPVMESYLSSLRKRECK